MLQTGKRLRSGLWGEATQTLLCAGDCRGGKARDMAVWCPGRLEPGMGLPGFQLGEGRRSEVKAGTSQREPVETMTKAEGRPAQCVVLWKPQKLCPTSCGASEAATEFPATQARRAAQLDLSYFKENSPNLDNATSGVRGQAQHHAGLQ